MADLVLDVKNLSKTFEGSKAVDNISFSIEKGQIVGLLGPNGAGKTTTINMLMGITTPTNGKISYFGKSFSEVRSEILEKVNFVSAFNTLQGRISVWENLQVYGHLYGVKDAEPKIKELVKYFEIEELVKKRYWDLSAGQKTRVNLIKAFLNDPLLVLMDEPTASLDPDIADKTLSFIEERRKQASISILYTSHDMEEVTRLCDQVIFLDHGRIFAQDSPLGLTKRIERATLNLTFDADQEKVETYLKSEKQDYEFTHKYSVSIKTEEKKIPKLIFGLSEQGIWITDIDVKKPTLEDVFLHIARGGKDES